MNKEELFNILYGKEKWEVYNKFKLIEESIDNSNQLYFYIDDIINLLSSDKSYIKVRAFRLICKLSKWDKENKIDEWVDKLLGTLFDEKPTNVRMCLAALNTLIIYKPNLIPIIKNKVQLIDYNKYKDTMKPLIKKDINILIENMKEV